MRSLIILEVEHGETLDRVEEFTNKIVQAAPNYLSLRDYSFRVDLPACFVLDSGS
jgi:hypothetical protein